MRQFWEEKKILEFYYSIAASAAAAAAAAAAFLALVAVLQMNIKSSESKLHGLLHLFFFRQESDAVVVVRLVPRLLPFFCSRAHQEQLGDPHNEQGLAS
jgi:hypothetical protein